MGRRQRQGDDTGFEAMPARYTGPGGREAIDIIRDFLGDAGFIAFCEGTALKYQLRAGKKDSPDEEKCRWYTLMAAHVRDPLNCPDPRAGRKEVS